MQGDERDGQTANPAASNAENWVNAGNWVKVLGVIVGIIVVVLAGAWIALRGPDIPYAQLEAKYRTASSRFVDLPGGFHVHYEEAGDPARPLLVLLHGVGDSYTSWE